MSRFLSAGLMQQQYDRVKLHITVMNTLFRKEPGSTTMSSHVETKSRTAKERESFDASNILKVSSCSSLAVWCISKRHTSFCHYMNVEEVLEISHVIWRVFFFWQNYGDYDFGAYTVDSIHLSQRFSTGSDGYYVPAAVMALASS